MAASPLFAKTEEVELISLGGARNEVNHGWPPARGRHHSSWKMNLSPRLYVSGLLLACFSP